MSILSRLAIRSIIRCKCVCKSWVDLIESCEFAKSHLRNSKAISGLAFSDRSSKEYHFHEFVEEHDGDDTTIWRHLSRALALKLSLPPLLKHDHVFLRGAASLNGLILLSDARVERRDHFVCNPLTRTYIKLPPVCPDPYQGFGFGVSKMGGEYKIVRLFSDRSEVYTLGTGTGSWRSVARDNKGVFTSYIYNTMGEFLNGKLHWIVREDWALAVSCFDLDTELFTSFPAPPPHVRSYYSTISILEGCLAFCHSTRESFEREGFVIWLMNDRDKSWTRRFTVTNASGDIGYQFISPVRAFKDGDILIGQPCLPWLCCYFNNTNNITRLNVPFSPTSEALIYTPTFLPLKTFSKENVISF